MILSTFNMLSLWCKNTFFSKASIVYSTKTMEQDSTNYITSCRWEICARITLLYFNKPKYLIKTVKILHKAASCTA